MSLFAIGDLHLAIGEPDKTMEAFGGRWTGYVDKIRRGFDLLHEDDTCVICGDFCWAMSLAEALPDFQFLNSLPGKKLMVKGNHDYWWTTAAKMNAFFAQNGLDTISLLHNNSAEWENLALCGTRGWFKDEETGTEHDAKVLRREVGRLETSLKCAGEREKLVFLIIRRCIFIIPVRRYCMFSPNTACMSAVTAISTATAAAARSSARAMASGTALFPQIFLILFRISSDNPLQFAF